MRKLFIIVVVCALIGTSLVAARATDLPINIDAIRQHEGYDDAVTARSNIDLFTESSQKVSEYMAEQIRLNREMASTALFETLQFGQTIDLPNQVIAAAEDFALFVQPVNYSNVKMPADTALIPLWLMILLFVACAVGGFAIARIIAQRKGKKADVH